MVHVAPAANGPGLAQVVDGSTAYGLPVGKASEEILSAVNWLFLSVKLLIALFSPTTRLPKFSAAAERVVGTIPVPLSPTVRAFALVLIVSVPAG